MFLKTLFGLPMTPAEVETFTRFTGRTMPPTTAAREAWLVVGRRGGKSRIAALIAVFLACFKSYRHILAPGERGVVMVLAADREQARVVFGYIEALLEQVPMLAALIAHRTKEEITLTEPDHDPRPHGELPQRAGVHHRRRAPRRGGVLAKRGLREPRHRDRRRAPPRHGHGAGAAAARDLQPLRAARRAVGGVQNPLRPGQPPVLVWKAPTTAMNPTISEAFVAAELEKDEAAARAEYLAEFRTDIETFFSREIVEACIEPGVHARPPLDGIRYTAFVDPSGGVGDSFALAIAHAEGDDVVLDLVHERRAPLSPEAAVQEFVGLLRPYRVREVIGDRYARNWVRERFRTHGIDYEVSRWTKSRTSTSNCSPLLTSQRARLLDQPRLVAQLLSLERRTGASGRTRSPIPAMGTTTWRMRSRGPSSTSHGEVNWASRDGNPTCPSPSARAARDRGRGHRAVVALVPERRLRLADPRGPWTRAVPRVQPSGPTGQRWCGGSRRPGPRYQAVVTCRRHVLPPGTGPWGIPRDLSSSRLPFARRPPWRSLSGDILPHPHAIQV